MKMRNMKHNVPNKKERIRSLVKKLGEHGLPAHVSDAKNDGTVFIRFFSCDEISAVEAAEFWGRHLTQTGADFTQVEDHIIRMPLP